MSLKTLFVSALLLSSFSNVYAEKLSLDEAKDLFETKEVTPDQALELPSELFTEEMAKELGMSVEYEGSTAIQGSLFLQSEDELNSLMDKARVVVHINKGIRSSTNSNGQTAVVYLDGKVHSTHDISSGTEQIKEVKRNGVVVKKYRATTPTGVFRPTKAYRKYDSQLFLGANMDYAVFFRGGIALHSTGQGNYSKLGKRASGGCIRFRRDEIQDVNELIVSMGEDNMNIVDQSFVSSGRKLTRSMYINRDKFNSVDRYSGSLNSDKVWTYDTMIVVTDK